MLVEVDRGAYIDRCPTGSAVHCCAAVPRLAALFIRGILAALGGHRSLPAHLEVPGLRHYCVTCGQESLVDLR